MEKVRCLKKKVIFPSNYFTVRLGLWEIVQLAYFYTLKSEFHLEIFISKKEMKMNCIFIGPREG